MTEPMLQADNLKKSYGTIQAVNGVSLHAAKGEMIGAIAMTEPAAGSDLQGIKTTAVKNGDHYLLMARKLLLPTAIYAIW